MKKLAIAAAITLTLAACGGPPESVDRMDTSHPDSAPGVPYPVDATIDGLTYAEWIAARADAELNSAEAAPCFGEGPVRFLQGSSGGPVERHCELPANVKLFFPVISYQQNMPCDGSDARFPDPEGTQRLTDQVVAVEDDVAMVGAEIDGRTIPNVGMYRAHSAPFMVVAPADRVSKDACLTGADQLGVADGYWLMLSPLTPGDHVLRLMGMQNVDQPWAKATYFLRVD